jgi:hypothetical protein
MGKFDGKFALIAAGKIRRSCFHQIEINRYKVAAFFNRVSNVKKRFVCDDESSVSADAS